VLFVTVHTSTVYRHRFSRWREN